jgi:hypothetical protein
MTMAVTREISQREWGSFLDRFSKRNQGRPARLEVAVSPGEGEPLLAENEPLLGVELDPKGSEAPAITVTLGGTDARTPHLTHRINDPTRLWIEEELDGLAIALEITSVDEGETRLIFAHEDALPPPEAATVAGRRA